MLCLLSIHQLSFAQKQIPLITNSGEIITKAIQLQDDEKYPEAISQLRAIPENDTNYYYAVAELANSFYGNKQYDSAIVLCKSMLTEESGDEASFYIVLGNSLDAQEKSSEAVDVLKEAVQKFPTSHLLVYNLGVAYRTEKKYPEALACFQKSSALNPYHPGSHLMLGITYLQADQLVPAMFGLTTFLLMNPTSPKAGDVIGFLQKVAQIEYKNDSDAFSLSLSPNEDDFSDIETILKSKIALSPKYKSQSKLNYDLVKQFQVLCEKLEPSANAKGFCNQNYVPFYSDLYKKGYYEALSYYILSSIDNPTIQSWLKKNDKKVKELINFTATRMRDISATNAVTVEGKPYNLMHWISESRVAALGNLAQDGQTYTGQWFFFADNNRVSKTGKFDNNGKEEGNWNFYYRTGELNEVHSFKAGQLNGTWKSYYRNSQPETELPYTSGQISGDVKSYHPTGKLRRQITIKDGNRNGPFTAFNQAGGKVEEGTYKNNELDGEYKTYYPNGNLRESSTYLNGKLNGDYKSLYQSGAKYSAGKYVNDQPVGTFKSFYENGKVKKEQTFASEGKLSGTMKEYYENGTLESETTYDNSGNEIGEKDYDDDGKLWMQINYKSGKVSEVIYYDKKGKVLVNNSRTRGMSPLTGYYPTGQLLDKGQFKNDYRVGKWTTYYEDGTTEKIENYNDDGDFEGDYKSYYPTGVLNEEYSYKKGKEDGYYKSYFQNGKIKSEGWFIEGDKSGVWQYYNELGMLTAREYYIGGETVGKQHYYDNLGHIYKTEVQEDGLLTKVMDYDTSGKVINAYEIKNGNGALSSVFFNGKKRFDLTLKDGWLDGSAKFYHVNGKVATEGNYKNDDRQGAWKWYDNSGAVSKEASYVDGSAEGKITNYINGKLYSVDYEVHNNSDSIFSWYFPSGKVEQTSAFKDDLRQGPTTLFSEEGSTYIVLNFEKDNLISYTYKGADGKLLPNIEIKNQSGTLTTYFPDKKKCYEGVYKNGWREGKFNRYFPSGAIREERVYKNNLLEGVVKEYNASGKVIREENYFYGDKHGSCKYYSDDGKLVREENYLLGDPHGEWKYYDKNGKVTKKVHYYLGEQLD